MAARPPAGVDAHRADPITDLGLTSGDYADLTAVLASIVPPGRRLLFLEGGYDLDDSALCTGLALSALVDDGVDPHRGGHERRTGEAGALQPLQIGELADG